MNITLSLSAEKQAELRKQAAAAGTDVASYVLVLVEQTLQADQGGLADGDMPYEQWRSDFNAWVSSHRSRNPNFDDSRESIYD